MRIDPEIHASLQYENRNLKRELAAFKSGDIYLKFKQANKNIRHYYERRLKQSDEMIHRLQIQIVSNRNMWFCTFQDVEYNCAIRLKEKDKELSAVYSMLKKECKINADLRERSAEKTRQIVELRSENEDLKEQIQNLKAEKNQGFENSSIPSSKDIFRPAVPNNREKTGRKPGAQKGHKGHTRKKFNVAEKSVYVEAPEEIRNDPDYYVEKDPTEDDGLKKVRKQSVGITILLTVTEYYTYAYRKRSTGGRYHAPFPDGLRLEVNYDDSLKGLIFIMKNHLNVSEDKIRGFISDLTNGEVNVSRGFINGINHEFSRKTKEEQEEIFARLSTSDVLYTDMTGTRLNGKFKNITVCSNKTEVMYAFKDKKGFEGVKGTPLEDFNGTAVHDGDKTFLKYGSAHQTCNSHHLRYSKGASEIETDRSWHKKMHELLREINRTRELQARILTEEQIRDFEKRYDETVALAEKEYTDDPPSKYYRKGYNLFKEFKRDKEYVLYFLSHPEVDFTNNEAERCCRAAKRHTAVNGGFRGETNKSGDEYCKALSVLQTMRRRDNSGLYERIKEIFKREYQPDIKETEKAEKNRPEKQEC